MNQLKRHGVKIEEITYLSSDIMIIGFKVPDTFTFKAGQFFKIIFDMFDENGTRSYSILNPPSEKGIVKSCIKLIPGGYGSEKLKEFKVGDDCIIEGPYGVLVLDDKSKDHVLICNGTGVTPFYSMLFEYVHVMKDHNFVLIYGTSTKEQLVLHEELLGLETANKNFKYIPTLTREISEKWTGRTGRVQNHISELNDFKDKTFYICGLKNMIMDVREELKKHGAEKIHIERYN